MSTALVCTGCQKRYVWNLKYAGRKVKCRCGQLLHMPAIEPVEQDKPASPAIAPFELMTEPSPGPTSTRAPTASAADVSSSAQTLELALSLDEIQAQASRGPSAALAAAMSARPSRVAEALANREDEVALSPWKEKYIPASIAAGGVGLQVALWFLFATSARHAAMGAAGLLAAEVIVLMPIAIAAVFLTARIMNIGFGPLVPALIKVAAIAIGAGGVADLLFFKMMLGVDFEYQMLLVAFVLHMILLGLPMLAIFELELSEMVMIVTIIVVPRIVILFGMGFLFPHWF